jgi:cytochrome c-type biogenesis protein CcmH
MRTRIDVRVGQLAGARLAGYRRGLFLLALLLLLPLRSQAVIETYEFSAPDLEQRYHILSQELRCPKCQNQNIADSNAPISQDLRKLLYEKLEAGASDEAILRDMVERYGEFVRYRPDAQGATLWLWLAPGLMLLAGLFALALFIRRAREPLRETADLDLSADEAERLRALLGDDEDDEVRGA